MGVMWVVESTPKPGSWHTAARRFGGVGAGFCSGVKARVAMVVSRDGCLGNKLNDQQRKRVRSKGLIVDRVSGLAVAEELYVAQDRRIVPTVAQISQHG